ncbi:MAG: thioredoxin domain-containing protein [Pseudomonadota bacterium]
MQKLLPAFVAMTAIALTPACAQQSADAPNKEAVEEIVREYILENPEIIEEALIALQAKRELEEQTANSLALAANADALFNTETDYSVGPADAPVTVVEFFDYRCGFCKRSADWAMALPEAYDGQVRVVFKELPILSAESEKAALAALAAGKQGKYNEMHVALMELDNSSGFGPDAIDAAAKDAEVDVVKMRADMSSVDVQRQLADMKALARTLGITGTPTFVVGTSQVPGADQNAVRTLIDAELAALN